MKTTHVTLKLVAFTAGLLLALPGNARGGQHLHAEHTATTAMTRPLTNANIKSADVVRKLQGVTLMVEPTMPVNPKPYSDIALNVRMTGEMASTVTKIRYIATRSDGVETIIESSASPFRAALRALGAGSYTLRASAWDNTGARVDALAVSFNWRPRPMMLPTQIITPPPPPPPPPPINAVPTVVITSPANASSVSLGNQVNITANAADSDGSIVKVEFFAGTTKLGEDAASPFNWAWTPTVAGQFSLTARATDNAGATTVSSAVALTIAPMPMPPPPPPPPPPAANIAPRSALHPLRLVAAQPWQRR
ncbi:MAG: hypothetical protein HC782_02400 [Gammaproteobacteria bacterium]|nr:hypothetical protein [Gammaproteobacteria bacterium]